MNNRQRRAYLKQAGILKAKKDLPYKKWLEVISNNIQHGKNKHEEYVDNCLKSIESQLSQMEQRMRLSCTGWNFSKEESDEYINNWISNLKSWPDVK